MVPTPRNPTPLITCDAIRERSDFPGKYTSIYCAVNITSVAPRHTIVFVFVPAPRFFNPLSRPITHPSIMETTILIKTLGIVHSAHEKPNMRFLLMTFCSRISFIILYHIFICFFKHFNILCFLFIILYFNAYYFQLYRNKIIVSFFCQ